ncbi:MAG TPA: hypothetical protein PKD64_18345 [Pirellulaceae bacterium]|nr:hypothetical protein [Pirellulaceae bacterium]HMO94150.1 hypothetical protein [Pirellulaceae bacterium]HMP71165.1 hypothetical protein [Pirellulaceae bacterium]
MKSPINNPLLAMLWLRAELLPAHVASDLRQHIESNEKLRKYWLAINSAWTIESSRRPKLNPCNRIDVGIDADMVASFIDGTLDAKNSAEVARMAWRSNDLLAEICLVFRTLHLTGQEALVVFDGYDFDHKQFSERIYGHLGETIRLRRIVDEDVDNLAKSKYAKEVDDDLQRPIHNLTGLVNPRTEDRRLPIRPNKFGFSLMAAGATAVLFFIALGIFSIYMMMDRTSGIAESRENDEQLDIGSVNRDNRLVNLPRESTNSGTTIVSESDGDAAELPTNLPKHQLAESTDSRFPPTALEQPGLTERGAPQIDGVRDWLVDLPVEQEPVLPDLVIEEPKKYEVVTSALQLEQRDVKGLVGYHVPELGVWRGINSKHSDVSNANVIVFANSWLRGEVQGIGEVIIDADTEIRFELETIFRTDNSSANRDDKIQTSHGDPDSLILPEKAERYVVHLFSGRVAFKNLPDTANMDIKFGPLSFTINTKGADSIFALDTYEGAPVLSVRRGRVAIDDQLVSAGRSLNFQQHWSNPTPTRRLLSWIDRSQRTPRMPRGMQDQLLQSEDLQAELLAMSQNDNRTFRNIGYEWLFTVSSDYVRQSLENPTSIDDWNLLLEWITKQHRRGNQQVQLWNLISDHVGDPIFGRLVFRWSQFLEQNEMPSAVDVEQLLPFLNHDQLFARFAAMKLLEARFGNPFNYDPTADQQTRVAVGRRWQAHIANSIGR